MEITWKEIIEKTAKTLGLSYKEVRTEIDNYEAILLEGIKHNVAPKYNFFGIGYIEFRHSKARKLAKYTKDEYWCELIQMLKEDEINDKILKYAYYEQIVSNKKDYET